jgi:hypothetical protein
MVAGPLFVPLSEPNIAPKDHASPPCFARAVGGLVVAIRVPTQDISRTLGPIGKTAQGRAAMLFAS